MNAEIVTIGTELLLGEIVDTNSAYLARTIRDIGLDLFYQTTVGDNEERAAAAISAALDRADVVITTGGLGPTVDDVTRQAVAEATGRPLELRQDLLEQIAERFQRWGAKMSDNNRQQAYVPAGALGLENPVGTAPCFAVECERGVVISLPGVPREMTYMMENVIIPYLQQKMGAPAVIVARVLRTAGIGESQVDVQIEDLERLSNPTVGLAAHAGQTDIRITAKAGTVEEAEKMIDPIVRDIRRRLGINIYGEGTETIEEIVLAMVQNRGLGLVLAEAGSKQNASERLKQLGNPPALRQLSSYDSYQELVELLGLPSDLTLEEIAHAAASKLRTDLETELSLVFLVDRPEEGPIRVAIATATETEVLSTERGYGGPPEYVSVWAITRGLDYLRRYLCR